MAIKQDPKTNSKPDNKQSSAELASQWAASGVSILNGMFGDYLHQRQNGLAIDMAFIHDGQPLTLDRSSLLLAYPQASGKLCIFIHGLCCNERSWLFADDADTPIEESYGSLLQKELGSTSLYLRYNTGRPLADNGEQFARLLGALVLASPVAIEQIVLIGHSMGGLIIRSACEFANQRGAEPDAAWLAYVDKAFYLGTPHEGADLEKLTHVAAAVLDAVPNPITRVIGDVLNLRSQGIKNLRDAQALRPDIPGTSSDAMPWLSQMQHYLIAGTLHEDPQHMVSQLFGDGLVRVPGADGNLRLPDDHIKVFPGVHHMALAHDRIVYNQIKQWIAQPERSA
jgi:triacylglycerol lipase